MLNAYEGVGGFTSPPPSRSASWNPQPPFLEISPPPPPHYTPRVMTSAEGGVAGAFPADAAMPIYGQAGGRSGNPLPLFPSAARHRPPHGGTLPVWVGGGRGGVSGVQGWFFLGSGRKDAEFNCPGGGREFICPGGGGGE